MRSRVTRVAAQASASIRTFGTAREYADLRLILLGSLVLLLVLALSDWAGFLAPVRVALGIVYVLYVPGYCLMSTLFPVPDDLDGVERVGLSIGLSIGLVSPLALLLNGLPWGIHFWPILIAEYGITALFAGTALWRRARLPTNGRYAPASRWHLQDAWQALAPAERRIYMLLAAILVISSLVTLWILAVPAPDRFMTEFYVLGKDGRAEDYPQTAASGEELTLTIGIVNRERSARSYRVEVWAIDDWNQDHQMLVGQLGPVFLPPGARDQEPASWHMPWPGNDQRVELLLFVGDSAEPYRKLRLWMNVLPASG